MPYPFFFNGEELSRWSSQWHLCRLGDFLNDFTDGPETGWDEFIGFQHIWHLQCRIDHVGSVESEDPAIFRICAQEVLKALLLNRDQVINLLHPDKLVANGVVFTDNLRAEETFFQIVEGITKMINLCVRDGCAFWTSGHEEDRQQVLDWMRQRTLPSDHPDFREPPHLSQRRLEQARRTELQLSELRSLAKEGRSDDQLRKTINQLQG